MDGHVKMQRIQRANRVHLQVLSDVLKPEVLHARVPRLAQVAEARAEMQAILETQAALGRFCRAGNFDPTRTFQHVANIDSSVWSAILEVFGKYDEETGELAHDGLLYIYDSHAGHIKLNKPFFYALLDWLEASGYKCDMRGKIKLN